MTCGGELRLAVASELNAGLDHDDVDAERLGLQPEAVADRPEGGLVPWYHDPNGL